jgi:hypothetical protein
MNAHRHDVLRDWTIMQFVKTLYDCFIHFFIGLMNKNFSHHQLRYRFYPNNFSWQQERLSMQIQNFTAMHFDIAGQDLIQYYTIYQKTNNLLHP